MKETKPRCEVCTVFFGEIYQPSLDNPLRDEDCLHFEERIKRECKCGRPIFDKDPIEYYKRYANFCPKCIGDVNQAIKSKVIHRR